VSGTEYHSWLITTEIAGSTPVPAICGFSVTSARPTSCREELFDPVQPLHADVIQWLECRLAKAIVAGSNPAICSLCPIRLVARIAGFQSAETGSEPVWGTFQRGYMTTNFSEVVLTETNYPVFLAEAVTLGKKYVDALEEQAKRQGLTTKLS
jgi:hypothetical protein